MTFDEIKESLDFLDNWEDRYKFVIDLGAELAPLSDEERSKENRVEGCVSQVWIVFDEAGDEKFSLRGDSDALIVKGLVAIVVALFSGKSAREIIDTPALEIFEQIGMSEHLTSQRANGLKSMVERVYAEAQSRVH